MITIDRDMENFKNYSESNQEWAKIKSILLKCEYRA